MNHPHQARAARPRRSAMYFLSVVLLAGSLSGCASATDAGSTSIDLRGLWAYTAVQTSGTRVSYTGTLNFTQQTGATFNGSLDLQAATPQGVVTRVSAVVGGRVLAGNEIDFDAGFLDGTRRYVGMIAGDSITGSWATSDLAASGTYAMKRLR